MLPTLKKISNFHIILLLVGFFSVGLLSNVFPGGSRIVTIPFRIVVLFISIYIIIRGILNNHPIPIKKISIFITFWMLYLSRLIIDLYLRNITATVFNNNLDYLLNAVGICLIPCISILFIKEINFSWVLKWSYRVLFVTLILSLFINLSLDINENQPSYGRYGGGGALNTISYGHEGVTLSLLSIFLAIRTKRIISLFFYVSSFLLGLFVMYLAGSKSPLLALVLCCAFYFLVSRGLTKGLLIIFLIFLPFFIFSVEILGFLSQYGGSFLDRIMTSAAYGDQSRSMLFKEGLNQFSASPIWGSAFVLQGNTVGTWNGFYPHNIVVESLMALGLIGGILILHIIGKMIYLSYKLITNLNDNAWIGLIALQYLILAMFSNAIYTNHLFWYCTVLLLVSKPFKNSIPISIQRYIHSNAE